MTIIQRSFLWIAVALLAGCVSTEPSRPQPYPIPDPSVFASLSCEELAYKRDGYQQLLQNVAVDHSTDSHLHIPGLQANFQGLSNALALRNCPASGQTSAAPPSPVGDDSHCFAYYTNRNLMEPANTTTGVVSKPWQAGAIAGAPARVALTEFQAFLMSRVNSEQLGPLSCSTLAQSQSCTVSKADTGSFTHGTRLASVICSTSREAVEKGLASLRATNPLLHVIDWLPAERAAQVPVMPTAPVTSVTTAPPVEQSVTSVGAMYCTAVISTQHTYGATVSPVKLIVGAANDMRPSLTHYIAKVKQEQPGVWGEFKLNPVICAPGATVCMGEAKGPTGKTQNAFSFCHATQAKADAELHQMRQGDPKAVVVEWP